MTTSPAPISAADREKAKELCAKATPGPWSAKIEPTSYPECDDADLPSIVRGENGEEVTSIDERYRNGAELQAKQATYEIDGEFIAFSRTAIPAYEARVVELEAIVAAQERGIVDLGRQAAAQYREQEARATALLEALTLALQRLERTEPTDSRAISAEFVSMAAVLSGVDDEGHHKLIRAAINAGASNDRK